MEGLLRLLFVGWVCLLHPCPGILGREVTGTPEECKKAEFAPGYNLGGEGFDIVKMERKGRYVVNTEAWKKEDGTCSLVQNPYLDGIQQKLPVSVVDWRALPKCNMKVSSSVFESSEALVNDSMSSVTNNWKVGLSFPVDPNVKVGVGLGGTHSREATYGMKKSKEDKFTFTTHEVHCRLYRYGVRSEIHTDFLKSINMLPKIYSSKTKPHYKNLIDTYGTHYIYNVELGGKLKSVTSIRSCEAALSGLTDTAVKDCLDVEASATVAMTAEIKTEAHHCKELKKKMGTNERFSTMFNDRHTEIVGGKVESGDLLFSAGSDPQAYKSWLGSLKTVPDVVFYSLKPLYFLMPEDHPALGGVKKAIEEYIMDNALLKTCSESCQIGTRSSARDPCACVCNKNEVTKSNCCPAERGLAMLQVYGMSGKGLWGDYISQTDGYVEVSFGDQMRQTAVINDNDNPNWQESFEFGVFKMRMTSMLTFQVYDKDNLWKRDLLGECSIELRSGTVSDTCYLKHGTFFFSYKVTCAPSLGGQRCSDYVPSPMSSSQANRFHSRNGILAGKIWHVGSSGNYSENGFFTL